MKYSGGCHCKAIRFEVDMELKGIISCNCSICTMKNHWLGFTPAKNFKLLSGEDQISTYMFNKKVIKHQFCKVCGIGMFGAGTMPDGTEMRSINVRCLDGIDLSQIEVSPVNGKDF